MGLFNNHFIIIQFFTFFIFVGLLIVAKPYLAVKIYLNN